MCGILGFIAAEKYIKKFSYERSHKILNLLTRRGPDACDSIYEQKGSYNIFLGHTRLSIQNLSSEFNQPYSSKPHKNVLIYNGEIYNYKNYLEYKNYTSDTKALYNLLSTSEKNLKKFDGIFSFAFWNENEKLLYLARDRFGVKPLFTFSINGFFAFSSSIRALEKLIFSEVGINYGFINESIEFGYNHNNSTLYKKIEKCSKNTLTKFNPQDWSFKSEKIYNDVFNSNNSKEKLSLNKLENKISESLSSQIITSDRGFGFFLSGGTDSSLLVSEAIKLNLNTLIKTFSLILPGQESDESQNLSLFKKIIGKRKNITHKTNSFNKKEILEALSLYPKLDYPVLDLSILPTIVLCKSVDKNIRVILSGDGADEIFIGYKRIYDTFWRFLFIGLIPKKIKNLIIKILPKKSKFRKYFSVKHPIEMRELLMGINYKYPETYKYYSNNIISIFESIIKYEINYYLPSVLEKVDAASMLSSLEVRVPYLSNKIIDYINQISLTSFLFQRTTKYFLKKLLSLNTSKRYAFTKKKGFGFTENKQIKFIIKSLELKNYPLLFDEKKETIISKNEIKYIRLLLLKHWIYGYN